MTPLNGSQVGPTQSVEITLGLQSFPSHLLRILVNIGVSLYWVIKLSAIPIPSVTKKMERIKLQGEITSPINPEKGCRFAKRCIYAKDICRQEDPKLKEVGKGHFFACHLAEELGFVDENN